MKVYLEHKTDMWLQGKNSKGLVTDFDASPDFGGKDHGPTPKEIFLESALACTALDIIAFLKKMRVDFDSLAIEAEADVSEEHPKVFTKIRIKYILKGQDIDGEKVKKAINMSQEKYCSVSIMLRKAVPDFEYGFEIIS
jgi:putative redox protein